MTARGPYDVRTKLELTKRQEQVLDLIARGYTNAQIGDELGITLDGAKWHVSEIISKLGVSSRDEAALYWRQYNRPGARLRRSWAGLAGGLSLKWGVAAASIVAVVGIGGLAILLAMNSAGSAAEQPTPATTPFEGEPETPLDLLRRVDAALRGVGEVAYLHAEVHMPAVDGSLTPFANVDVWFDSESDAVRSHWVKDPSVTWDIAEEAIHLDRDGSRYYVDVSSSPPVKRHDMTGNEYDDCYPGEPNLPVTPLLCAFGRGLASNPTLAIERSATFEGREVMAVVVDGGSPPNLVSRLLVEPISYLPVALTATPPNGGEDLVLARYEIEAVSRDSVGDDFFDPVAFGWVDPNEADRKAMAEVALEWGLYWLGDRYRDPEGRVFPLTDVEDYRINGQAAEPGIQGPGHVLSLEYRSGDGRARLDFWPPDAWDEFADVIAVSFQCTSSRVVSLPGSELTIHSSFEATDWGTGPRVVPEGETAVPDLFEGDCPDGPHDRFMAVVTYPEVTVTINAPYGRFPYGGDVFGVFDTEEALEALARELEPWLQGSQS